MLGYLERRKIKTQIENINTSHQSWKDRREAEKELAEAKKKEIREMVLAFTGKIGELTPDPVDLGNLANQPSRKPVDDRGIGDAPDEPLEAEKLSQDSSKCPRCGGHVENDYRSCPNCATRLRQECPGCHELVPISFRACPKCGNPFSRLWDPMADVRDD